VVEVDVPVGARKHRLVFTAALRVEARLEIVRTDDLGDVVNEVERVILVDERQSIEINDRESLIGDPTVTEVRYITEAHIREQLWNVYIVSARKGVVIGGAQVNEVATRPKDEFVGESRAESMR